MTSMSSMVIRAAIKNELSGPLAEIRTELAGVRSSVDDLNSSTGAGAKGLSDYGSGIKDVKDSTAGLKDATQSLRNISLLTTASFAGAVTVIARFESSLSELKVASGATTQQMGLLRQAAIEAGKTGIFTETDAVSGMTALAKAGISVTDILKGGLKGAMSLAAAGGEDLGTAAETMSSALSQFNLDGTQASHVADLLAAGAGKAQGSVGDLAESLKYAGLTSHLVGIPIEQTVGTLAMFAQKGLLGSKAGTALQQMLLRLSPPAGIARDTITRLGISAFDTQGRFIGLANFAQLLHTKLSGMSEEQRQATLSQVFGSHAIQAATILYEQGAKGVKDWTAAVNDSGYAADYAHGRLDNLSGDTLKLRGSLQALITGSGSATNTMLRTMTQHLTNDVDLFGRLPKGIQSSALAMFGIVSVGTLAITTVALIVTKMKEMEVALAAGGSMSKAMGAAVGFARVGFLAAIPVIGLAAIAIDYFGKKAAERKKDVTSLSDAISEDGNVIGESTRKLIAKSLVDDKAIANAKKLGISAGAVTTATIAQGVALDDLHTRLNKIIDAGTTIHYQGSRYGSVPVKQYNDQATAARALSGTIDDQVGKLREAQKTDQEMAAALEATSTVNQKVQAATGQSTTAMYAQQLQMQNNTDSASALKNMLDELNGVNLTLAQNQVTYHQSLLAIGSAVDSNVKSQDANAKSLSLLNNAGLTNNANINAAVQNAEQLAQAYANQTGSVELGAAKFGAYRQQIEKAATDAGISKKAVDALLDSIAQGIQLKPEIPVHANTKPAKAEVRSFILGVGTSAAARVPIGAAVAPANAAINSFLKHVGELRPVLSLQGVVTLITQPAALGSTPNPKVNAGVPFKSLGTGPGRAFGGPVTGPGSARSDSLLVPLSTQEWVMPWDARAFYGDEFMAAVQARALPRTGGPDLAAPARSAGGYAGGITVAAGAVVVHVQGDATPRELAAADIPGQVAEGLRRWEQDRAER